jgi:poly-gamma-glutamate capsule biosynthesis protein CapA/YwtB (metallophosphatase superfamily)
LSDPLDPNTQPRYPAPASAGLPPPGRGTRPIVSYIVVLALVALFVLGAAGFAVMAITAKPSTSPGESGAPPSGDAAPAASALESALLAASMTPGQTDTPAPPETTAPAQTNGGSDTFPSPVPSTSEPASSPGATASEPSGPVGELQMPMVPVVSFWSTQDVISLHDLKAALQGQASDYKGVIVPTDDGDAIAAALGIQLGSGVQTGSAADILAKTRSGWLGVVRGSDLGPQVRALAIDGTDLVGEDHVKKLSQWPFVATVSAPTSETWDQANTWTIAAGGDIFFDRGVENTTLKKGYGVNYPFQGGTAVVTGHCACSPSQQIPNELVPTVKRTGHSGAVRDLVQGADLTLANLENPIPDDPTWHLSGTVFGGPPKLLGMLNYAGIDWVSLANNHMYDYGATGIEQTRSNLKAAGIPFGGAGSDLAEAGQISYLTADGRKVAIVACQAIVDWINAGTSSAGTNPCKAKVTVPLIQEARQKADVVIVFAHWGHEFFRQPYDKQPPLAQKWIEAGADIVMGSHPHLYGGLQDIEGKPVIYSMGNFIFDQYWSTATMESALTEITFQGDHVVQIRLHPFVILDQAQPNLLNPATDDGKALLGQVKQVADSLGW